MAGGVEDFIEQARQRAAAAVAAAAESTAAAAARPPTPSEYLYAPRAPAEAERRGGARCGPSGGARKWTGTPNWRRRPAAAALR